MHDFFRLLRNRCGRRRGKMGKEKTPRIYQFLELTADPPSFYNLYEPKIRTLYSIYKDVNVNNNKGNMCTILIV